MSRFLCVFIAEFPAWAAVRGAPHLRNRAVLICHNGRVVSASPKARRAGVQAGCSLAEARSLLPEAVVLPNSPSLVAAAWQRVLEALHHITPRIESARCGMALLHLDATDAIKPLLRDWTAQGGVADDRSTAEVAALTAVAGTLHAVPAGRAGTFLSGVPLRVLEQVGLSAQSGQRLHSLGWRHVGELRYLPKQHLAEMLPEAELLLRYAQAADRRPVGYWTPPPTISAHFDFGEPAVEAFEVDATLELLIARLHEQLAGRQAHSVTLTATTEFDEVQRHRSYHEPLSSLLGLHVAVQELQKEFPSCFGGRRLQVQRIELRLGRLVHPHPAQGLLFAMRPHWKDVVRRAERRFSNVAWRIRLNRLSPLIEDEPRLEPVLA
jgi:nucleotidyltransferase/DNA polymerase involved in DNA repair